MDNTHDDRNDKAGFLAHIAGKCFPLQVCKSAAGHYIGTLSEDGEPYTRESKEYWKSPEKAETALRTRSWTQRTQL